MQKMFTPPTQDIYRLKQRAMGTPDSKKKINKKKTKKLVCIVSTGCKTNVLKFC